MKAPPRPCTQPGCPAYSTHRGRCPEHQKRQYDADRGSAHSRGYDRRWRKVREMALRRQPMCEHCEVKPAIDVDHIVPIRQGGARYDLANLQALCRRCHNIKTAGERVD